MMRKWIAVALLIAGLVAFLVVTLFVLGGR